MLNSINIFILHYKVLVISCLYIENVRNISRDAKTDVCFYEEDIEISKHFICHLSLTLWRRVNVVTMCIQSFVHNNEDIIISHLLLHNSVLPAMMVMKMKELINIFDIVFIVWKTIRASLSLNSRYFNGSLLGSVMI